MLAAAYCPAGIAAEDAPLGELLAVPLGESSRGEVLSDGPESAAWG